MESVNNLPNQVEYLLKLIRNANLLLSLFSKGQG